MNIKRAKKEIQDSVTAYLKKDFYGEYMIPSIRQRPILLMGPPGIGKTQIMEQVASTAALLLSPTPLPIIQGKVQWGFPLSERKPTERKHILSRNIP